MTYICYHWDSGAYLSGVSTDFAQLMAELCTQFGPPARVTRSALSEDF